MTSARANAVAGGMFWLPVIFMRSKCAISPERRPMHNQELRRRYFALIPPLVSVRHSRLGSVMAIPG